MKAQGPRYIKPIGKDGSPFSRKGKFYVSSQVYPYVETMLDEAAEAIARAIALRKGDPSVIIPPRFEDWVQQRFYIPQTGKPAVLFPHQIAISRLMLTRDERNKFPYSTLIYSSIKKSGKSTWAGMVLRWYAENGQRHSELFCLGNDRDQAKLRSFREIRRSIELSPGYDHLRDRLPGEWTLQKETFRSVRTGTEIRALPIDPKGEAGGAPAMQCWCVDDQTECLTRAGWKLVVNLTTEDEVATLNPKSGEMEWERPRAVNVMSYKGKMSTFSSRRVDFVVTPNHRVYGKFITHSRYKPEIMQRDWWFEEASAAAKYAGGWLKGDAAWSGSTYSPSLARLHGYYAAEGHARDGWITISQSLEANPTTYEDIRRTVIALGYQPKCSPRWVRFKDVRLAAQLQALGGSPVRYVPQEVKDADTLALRNFFDAYIAGDGWKTEQDDGWQASTTSKRLADDLMEIGLKLGYHPRLMSVRPPRTHFNGPGGKAVIGRHPTYRVSFSTGAIAWERAYGGKKAGAWGEINYDGLVACPSVRSGIFYIRRMGKCVWTGNTELWGVDQEEGQKFWDELTPVPTIPDSIRIVETYAGFLQDSLLLYNLYETGLHGHQLTAGELAERTGTPIGVFLESPNADDLVPIWENKAAGLCMYWDEGVQARRMPWQLGEEGEQYYREQEQALRTPAFRRLHYNEWVSDTENFIQPELWDSCRIPKEEEHLIDIPVPGDRTPLVLGVDAATTGDCFALVLVSRHPLRQHEIAVRAVKVYDPKEMGGVVDYSVPDYFIRFLCEGGHVENGKPHPKSHMAQDAWHAEEKPDGCHQCAERVVNVEPLNITQVAYDPYQLEKVMQDIRRDINVWCEPFNQSGQRLIADRSLYDGVIRKQIWHKGGAPGDRDERLRQHVLAAGAKMSKDEDTKLRLVKTAPHRKIDAAVALSMAADRCLYLNI